MGIGLTTKSSERHVKKETGAFSIRYWVGQKVHLVLSI